MRDASGISERMASHRLLVADDDPSLRRLVATTLRRAGYDVVEARDGVETIDRLAVGRWARGRDAVDAVVSDVRMPRLSGLDVLAALRATQWPTPVIMFTGAADPDERAEAVRLGAVAVLDKPIARDRLLFTIRRALVAREEE